MQHNTHVCMTFLRKANMELKDIISKYLQSINEISPIKSSQQVPTKVGIKPPNTYVVNQPIFYWQGIVLMTWAPISGKGSH